MDRLAQLRREIARAARAVARPRRQRRPGHLVALASVAVLVVLPFLLLLRGATYLYAHRGWPTWVAIGGAAALTLALLTGYAALLSRQLTGRARTRFVAQWIAAPLAIVYCANALLFLASVNAKTGDVRAYDRSLHPALRLAVSTFVIVDPGLVVTDIHRTPADHGAMGLPVFEASLHFRQRDDYLHAMDLRTIGRGAVRNRTTAAYFRVLGFRSLRHVGTAYRQSWHYGLREVDGLPVVSDLQLFLDLSSYPRRGAEQASPIRDRILGTESEGSAT